MRRENEGVSSQPNRRAFLTGAGATALAGLTAACSADGEGGQEPTVGPTTPPSPAPVVAEAVAFRGMHQVGVLQPVSAAGIVATFDVIDTDAAALATTLQGLTVEIERIMGGEPPVAEEEFLPPVDSGAVEPSRTLGTSVTVAAGASLFDQRFGLGDRRPTELIAMPRFFNDRRVRPELSHGDLAFTISGPSRQATAYALHQIVRVAARGLRLRWVQEGYNDLLPPDPDRIAPTRNLMGFRDGTSNLDTADPAVMDEHVWVAPDDAEPDWATGGTYQAVRIIRMLIEFWATAALVRQEQIFGRHRASGAPLGQGHERDEPRFATDPSDETVPRRSHLRLANPRTPDTGRLLRRGFSFLNGADPSDGTLDQGLLFLAYQRSLNRGFLAAQARLDGEPLEDYVKPVGGGLFFVLPGPGEDGWLGESLLA